MTEAGAFWKRRGDTDKHLLKLIRGLKLDFTSCYLSNLHHYTECKSSHYNELTVFEKHPLLTSCGRARLHQTIHIQDLFSTCWHETKKRPQIKSDLVDDVQRKSPLPHTQKQNLGSTCW